MWGHAWASSAVRARHGALVTALHATTRLAGVRMVDVVPWSGQWTAYYHSV